MSNFRFTRNDPFPPITKNLIIINVLVFVAQMILDPQMNLTGKIAMYPLRHPAFEPYQIATHMFAHGGLGHILFNMFALWMFGKTLENVWGPKRFLLFYLICGVGAAAAHLGIQEIALQRAEALYAEGSVAAAKDAARSLGPALGASGAIMGVVVAFAYLFPNTELFIMFIPIPVKAKWAVIGFVAIDLFYGVANVSNDNVARFAHLGGALTGFILVWIWNKNSRKRFY